MSYPIDIARICHEANRAYCATLGDFSQSSWDVAPGWQQTSAIRGVEAAQVNLDATPQSQHEVWLADKVADGWVYGPVKDPAAKTHPCCIPYHELPISQQKKDKLFLAIVRAMS